MNPTMPPSNPSKALRTPLSPQSHRQRSARHGLNFSGCSAKNQCAAPPGTDQTPAGLLRAVVGFVPGSSHSTPKVASSARLTLLPEFSTSITTKGQLANRKVATMVTLEEVEGSLLQKPSYVRFSLSMPSS